MRIKTITCHDVYNYGASLQAYALQQYLETEGHEVQIINYKPDYLSFHYKLSLYIPKDLYAYKPSLKYGIVRLLFVIYRYLLSMKTVNRMLRFNLFTKHFLHLTAPYKDYSQLSNEEAKKIVDIYIAGSDQIWNSQLMENGKDPAFYLDFIPVKVKKISYAASFGSQTINEDFLPLIKSWLQKFNNISVRETSGKRILDSLNIPSDIVCDPVFLLNKQQWRNLCNKPISESYILIYNIGAISDNLINAAKCIANKYNLKVYSILDTYHIKNIDRNITNAGPIEFINYLYHAEYVVSNSFHATAFSLIFNKQFLTYSFKNVNSSSRMINLLEEVSLEDRFEVSNIEALTQINYSTYCNTINQMAEKGRQWLLHAIHDSI